MGYNFTEAFVSEEPAQVTPSSKLQILIFNMKKTEDCKLKANNHCHHVGPHGFDENADNKRRNNLNLRWEKIPQMALLR